MKRSVIHFINVLPKSYVFDVIFFSFWAFSASEFTLVFSISCLLTFHFITVFLSAIPFYKEVAAVTAAYHDPFRAIIGLPPYFLEWGFLKSFSPVWIMLYQIQSLRLPKVQYGWFLDLLSDAYWNRGCTQSACRAVSIIIVKFFCKLFIRQLLCRMALMIFDIGSISFIRFPLVGLTSIFSILWIFLKFLKKGILSKYFFSVGAQYTKSILYKWSIENGHIFMDGD